jgi:hypothetical protein
VSGSGGQRVTWTPAQYDDYVRRTGRGKTLVEIFAEEKTKSMPRKSKARRRAGKTQAEKDFEVYLKFQHPSVTILYEPIKLRIDASCWYLPDYFCPELVTFYEVKGGYLWDDAIVKFKAARAIHSWAKFEMWQRDTERRWRQIRELPGEEDGSEESQSLDNH